MSKHIILFILVVLLGSTRCRLPEKIQAVQLDPLPQAYSNPCDSLHRSPMLKVYFFNDSLLYELVEEALQRNADYLVAHQRIIQAQAALTQVRGLSKPFITAGGLPAIRRYGLYTMDGAGNATTDILENKRVPVHLPDFLVGFQSSWEIDIYKKWKSAKKAAQLRILASTEGKNWIQSNLIAVTAQMYLELLMLDQLEKEVTLQRALQAKALEAVRWKWEAGQETALSIHQMEALELRTAAMGVELDQRRRKVELELNALLGRFPQPIQRSNLANLEQALQTLPIGVPSDLLVHRPDIRALEAELFATLEEVAAARAAFLPSLNITASIGRQAFSPGLLLDPQSLAYSFVGNMLGPVFNRSQIQSNYDHAKATVDETWIKYRQAIVSGVSEVESILTLRDSWSTIAELKQQEVTSLDKAVNGSIALFQNGRTGYLETLFAQQAVLQARIEWVEARSQVLQTQVGLYKALGGGR